MSRDSSESMVNRSLRIPIWMDNLIRNQNIDFSKETRKLWKARLSGDSRNPTKDLIEIEMIKSDLKEKLNEISNLLERVEKLELNLKKKQEHKELEDQTDLIRKMEVWFENIDIENPSGQFKTSRELIERNLEFFSNKYNISLKEAEEIFKKAFPKFKDEIG